MPNVRQIGASLLASAGVAGLVAGIAARPVLGNLIAGLQIALSQPVRIDDVVVVQGEWGRVEAITGTYIAIRIWDERRLIVPLQWFIENAFQNWTRTSAQIIGSVFIWVDFRMPMEPLRVELARLCEAAGEWDRRVQVLQVTDANEHAMQLRALVSSTDSPLNWDLRCKIREGLLTFIQREYPAFLPRTRAEWHTAGADSLRGAASSESGLNAPLSDARNAAWQADPEFDPRFDSQAADRQADRLDAGHGGRGSGAGTIDGPVFSGAPSGGPVADHGWLDGSAGGANGDTNGDTNGGAGGGRQGR